MARQGVHRYSYSGADVKAIAYFNQRNQTKVHLESLHTLSLSVFEAKGRVRTLGFKSVRGFTRAVREIAGTMIMLVIEDHPFADLMRLNKITRTDTNLYGMDSRSSWSLDAKSTVHGAKALKFGGSYAGSWESDHAKVRRAPTTLPPFNLVLYYNTEVPNQNIWAPTTKSVADGVAAIEILDVEIVGEGIVTSVNDMVTEIQYQFLARDFREFALDREYGFEKSKKFIEMQLELEKLENEKKLNSKPGVSVNKSGTVTVTAAGSEPLSGVARKMARDMVKDLKFPIFGPGITDAILEPLQLNVPPETERSETTDGLSERGAANIDHFVDNLNNIENAAVNLELEKWIAADTMGTLNEDQEEIGNAILNVLPPKSKQLVDSNGDVIEGYELTSIRQASENSSDLLFCYESGSETVVETRDYYKLSDALNLNP